MSDLDFTGDHKTQVSNGMRVLSLLCETAMIDAVIELMHFD